MRREKLIRPVLGGVVLLALLTAAGCSGPFTGRELAALPVAREPTGEDWEKTVPLVVEAWMGNVHERPEIVALDRETSHRSTAQCHHGPSESDPVEVRLQALYSREEIFILAQWEDRTRDTDLGHWEKMAGGWAATPGADDGIALLWGPAVEGEFRCQSACHMVDVEVFDGRREMQMRMMFAGEGIADLWRWRSGVTAPFGLADDMAVDRDGKRGDEGQALILENHPPPTDAEAAAEGMTIPYVLIEPPGGDQADVRADGSWDRGHWKVLFRRRLVTGDGDDRVFTAGDRFGFGLGVFDNTFRDHHVVQEGLELRLVAAQGGALNEGKERYEPLDF